MIKKIVLLLIKTYQKTASPDHGIFSFWRKNAQNPPVTNVICRFYPSCSEYAHEAIEKFGLRKGGAMAVSRILRCHPLAEGGYDPVEENN